MQCEAEKSIKAQPFCNSATFSSLCAAVSKRFPTVPRRTMKFICGLLVFLGLVSTGQSMLYGQGVFLVSSPSDFLCKAFSFATPFTNGPVQVQLALHMNEPSAFTYEAAVSWVEEVSLSGFTACVAASGPISGNRTVSLQWMAYDSVPGGAFGQQVVLLWTTGTKCVTVNFAAASASFASVPFVYVTPVHSITRRKHDAASIWAEDVTRFDFKICLRELKNFDGEHKQFTVNWLAQLTPPSGWTVGIENAVTLPNTSPLTAATGYSFCEVVTFAHEFYSKPVMITTAKHSLTNDPKTIYPKNNAITEWIEEVTKTTFTVCMKDIQPYGGHHDPVTISYLAIGYLDPCINVQCTHYATCKAFGPKDARCVCPESCDNYEDPQCGSDGKTYTNMCYYRKYICETHLNVTIVHAGACYPFILHHGRVTLDLSKTEVQCQLVTYKTQNFNAERTVRVQVSVNYHNGPTNFVHDAAVAWAEKINVYNFTLCALKAGRNDRATPDAGITYVDYMAYQGAPTGAVSGEVTLSNWWEGTSCQSVDLPPGKFTGVPNALVSSEHMVVGQKHDAATIWLEDTTTSKLKVCLRELQDFDGLYKDIHVNWIAYENLPAEMKTEKLVLSFPNTNLPNAADNYAYCQTVNFNGNYTTSPTMIVTALHNSSVGKLLPDYNSISAWVEYITTSKFRVCLKELHAPNGYDPVVVTALAIGA